MPREDASSFPATEEEPIVLSHRFAPKDSPGSPQPGLLAVPAPRPDGPLIFQCAACKQVLADSLSIVALRKDLKVVVLAEVTEDVSISREPVTSKEPGSDLGSTYMSLTCVPCQEQVGRVYKTTSVHLDDLREHYSLDLLKVSVWVLNSRVVPLPSDIPDSLPQNVLHRYQLGSTRRHESLQAHGPEGVSARQLAADDRSQSLSSQVSFSTRNHHDQSHRCLGHHQRSPPPQTLQHHSRQQESTQRTHRPPGLQNGLPHLQAPSQQEMRKMQLLIMSMGERLMGVERILQQQDRMSHGSSAKGGQDQANDDDMSATPDGRSEAQGVTAESLDSNSVRRERAVESEAARRSTGQQKGETSASAHASRSKGRPISDERSELQKSLTSAVIARTPNASPGSSRDQQIRARETLPRPVRPSNVEIGPTRNGIIAEALFCSPSALNKDLVSGRSKTAKTASSPSNQSLVGGKYRNNGRSTADHGDKAPPRLGMGGSKNDLKGTGKEPGVTTLEHIDTNEADDELGLRSVEMAPSAKRSRQE